MPRICVVGAGPAGLVATKTLLRAGLEVDCFELSTAVGGHWVFDNPNGRSAVYRSIQTNTTPAMSRLSDFELPADAPDFPSHEQVRAWFESYVDAFGFRDRIQLGVEVTRAEPLDPLGWRVSLRDADGTTRVERYDALLACSGNCWAPRIPDWPGVFDGAFFHAQAYRDAERPEPLAGRRVIVVGTGNTGCEIACEIAKSGAEAVFLSARSGMWIVPKFKGDRPAAEGVPMMHPCDPVPAALRVLPRALRERLFLGVAGLMFRRMFADHMRRFEALGLPPAPPDPFGKRATACEPLPGALESGAVKARPGIERFDGREVVFTDGTRETADVVICATGFHLRYPYLPTDTVDTRGDDVRLYLGTMHPERSDLFVIGVSRPTGAFWPIAELHAQLAAACLSGRYAPPRAEVRRARAEPILRRRAFNPALYGLAVREEIRRGERRARREGRGR